MMRFYSFFVIAVCLVYVIKAIDAIPLAPASAPAMPNIPGLQSIVEDLMKVVEKAKSRWDALQSGGISLGSLLFPNRKRGPSRVDQTQANVQKQMNPFQALLDNELNAIPILMPYVKGDQQLNRRSSQINSVIAPSGPMYIPKNASPSTKLIHRPAAPVSNCLYGCLDGSAPQHVPNSNDWEDLFSNVQLTEY